MILMMGYYDSKYDLNFLLQILKLDIYRMEFNGQELVEVKRLWEILQIDFIYLQFFKMMCIIRKRVIMVIFFFMVLMGIEFNNLKNLVFQCIKFMFCLCYFEVKREGMFFGQNIFKVIF